MAWIEVHQTLPAHRKIKKLKRQLKCKTAQAVGHMIMLWLWAVDNAADGHLDGLDPEDIAEAAEWTGDPVKFLEALKEAGFVDGEERLSIHDWQEYTGKLMDKRDAKKERDKERQKQYRSRKKERDAPVTEAPRHADVTCDTPVTEALRHAPVTPLYSTVPYSTVPSTDEDGKKPAEEGAKLAPPSPPSSQAVDAYMRLISPTPSMASMRELLAFEREMDTGCCLRAIDQALDNNKRTWPYVKAVLETKKAQGVKTAEDWDRLEADRQDARHRRICAEAERRTDTPPDDGDLDLLLRELRDQGVELEDEGGITP